MKNLCRHSAAALAILALIAPLSAGEIPPRTESGQMLAAPAELGDRGEIYHVSAGEDAQLVITSDAQLQRTLVTCRRVVGYFATPFELQDGEPPLLVGALRIPVASLFSGSDGFDQLLRSPAMLDAAKYPEMTVELTGVQDARRLSGGDRDPVAYEMTLKGVLSVKDKAIELSAPAKLTLLPFTWRTMSRFPGDLMTLRTSFELKLADLAVQKPDRSWNDKLTDAVKVDVFLLANTVPPEKSLDPKITRQQLVKHLKYLTLIRDFNQPAEGYAWGRRLLADPATEAEALNRLAMDTLLEDGIRTRDLDFALAAARRASEMKKDADAAILDTVALAHFRRGDPKQAATWQRKAVEALGEAREAEDFKKRLAEYEAAAGAMPDGAATR
ncbi:YceI-like domain protein [Phycisphaerae bacterium RAS1]|nr:YceI-like domain protein [Phycisphaerae bacterium RAS1]